MRCPHCKQIIDTYNHDDISTAMINVENYGSNSFIFECEDCKKKFMLYIRRIVEIDEISLQKVSDDKDLSF